MTFSPAVRAAASPNDRPVHYEIQVLIENLTDDEFELVGTCADDGSGSLPETFERSAKLSWHSKNPCAAAAEYVTLGANPRRFCLAAALPAGLESTRFRATVAVSGGWRRPNDGLTRVRPPLQARLRGALRDASALKGMLDASDGCDWLVLQNEPSLLKVRVRLLPNIGAIPFANDSQADVLLTARECTGGVVASEEELERLRLYCSDIKGRNAQADKYELVSNAIPVDPSRLCALPEKVHIDLAMAVLGILLQRRLVTLETCANLEPAAVVASGAPAGRSAALSAHVDRCFRSMVRGMGFQEARVEQKLSGLACQYLKDVPDLPPPDVPEICRGLQEALGARGPTSVGGVPEAWLALRELTAALLTANEGAFDARSRAALLEFAVRMGISEQLMTRWEADLGEMLFDALTASKVVTEHQEDGKVRRRGKVALAAAGGGLLLAVTGGLAAPAVAAGVTGFGSAAATLGTAMGLSTAGAAVGTALASSGLLITTLGTSAGAAVVFGATGAGLTSWKLSTRWGALQEFKFEPLPRTASGDEFAVEVSDVNVVRELDAILEVCDGRISEWAVVRQRGELAAAGLPRGSRLRAREAHQDESDAAFIRYRFLREPPSVHSAVHLVVFVAGWIREDSDLTAPWQDGAELFFPRSGHLTLRWETVLLKELSSVVSKMLRSQIASSATSFWLRTAAVAGPASPVVWPVWIISSMANLDNKWLVCAERARLAGKCLAHVLADKHTVGQRPVTLIGHSMGARMIFYCLQELFRMGELNAVDDVVLFATPVTTQAAEWQRARAVVAGRLINVFLPSDWVLAFLYRYLEWGVFVAGLREVSVPGVENVDVAGLGVSSHSDYMRHALRILAKARAGERRPGQL